MKSLIDLIAVVIFCFVLMILFTGCSTTSIMQCDRYIGPEKKQCVKHIRFKQRQMLPVHQRVRSTR